MGTACSPCFQGLTSLLLSNREGKEMAEPALSLGKPEALCLPACPVTGGKQRPLEILSGCVFHEEEAGLRLQAL